MFAYIVRCNFTASDKEAAWNAWYSGPKMAQMLAKPLFCSCQRFKRASGIGRDYLALWTVRSPDAFVSREYTSDWGFFDWEAFVTDWSRDLFDAGPVPASSFAVAETGALHVIAFDRMSEQEAQSARATLDVSPKMNWLAVVGLDRHTPLIGLAVLGELDALDTQNRNTSLVQPAVYRPITRFTTA